MKHQTVWPWNRLCGDKPCPA